MLDFRLKVFYTVAKRLNFTKASQELFISQPAVTKHIRELEAYFKTTLLQRSGNSKVRLTSAGERLLQYTEKMNAMYTDLEFDMNMLVNQHTGMLRIGGSNTVSQYVIPAILAQFHERFKDVKVKLITGNTEQIEQAVINSEIELGIVEGVRRNAELKYEEFLKDELVLVCAARNRLVKKETILPSELKGLPFLLREPGSGTLDVITHALEPVGMVISDLKVEMQLSGAESIKAYLLNSNCFAFLSVQSILNELKSGSLKIIDVKGLAIERTFYFIQPHGHLPGLAQLFRRFSESYLDI
ncbi:LysR family transcriptional regulator [Mucilaginibacter sp. Bleaf8]|uniref:LysR family transcriptional regulator n=1 Tax=Mucilaginibacter sp. Bleaf8 TaxID=2834430 RepID=UPI001BCF19E0|nr:LysR family transcriptional regulator [Mucilaginibacter sp. Bleaf8]MBS7565365.1 LysR family transcriptional regulator [Mucilaginibacter sp. Bleaf8]